MEYVTVPDVEIATAGMNWPAMNGDITITLEHLADMVAAQDDPHIQPARLAIGHTDPRFNTEEELRQAHNPFYDGEPAVGKIVNLRLTNDGAVVVGDLTEVPAWLADALPSAYPNRSMEGAYLNGSWDVETPGGKKYSLVLTRVALLGIYLPAIQDLEDLERLLTQGPEGDEMGVVTDGELAQARVAAASGVKAAADVNKVIDVFFAEFATEEEGRYWWWPRAVWTDPNEIIADDDEGHLFRVPFTSDGEGGVTFSDPVEVRESFVDVTNGEPVAAAQREGRPRATFASREADGLPSRPKPATSRPEQKENSMSDTAVDLDALRKRLGLPEDATEEQINEALAETPEPAEEPAEEPTEEPGGSEEPQAAEEPEPVAASKGTVTVDAEAFEQVQRQAREGAAARAEQINIDRERKLDDAIKAGKIPPARKDHYRDLHKADPEGTEQLLSSLAPNTVPVEETGVTQVNDEAERAAIRASFGLKED